MRRLLAAIALLALLALPHDCLAQVQGQGGGYGPYGGAGFMPNNYNRQTQPLSPYLNLLRNGNPAVNYFYGVRPGLQAGGYLGPYGQQNGFGNGPRFTYFPYVNTLADYQPDDPRSGMPPSGHGIGFNTTFGAYPTSSYGPAGRGYGNAGAGGVGPGGQPTIGGRQGYLQAPRR